MQTDVRHLGRIFSPIFVLLVATGCPSVDSLPSQAPVQELESSKDKRPYLLYVPSIYDDKRPMPLVVLCHGTWPYDTAPLQMREWAAFAESRGIIVAAPTLQGVQSDLPPPPNRQIALQQADEATILDIVSELKRRYRISESEVFMTGWSGGAYAVLHTGLKHPEIFRALFVQQGAFDARFMADVSTDRLDTWQCIRVEFGHADLIRDQSKACIKWLRDSGLYVEELETSGSHKRVDASVPWSYFKQVAKERLWVRVRMQHPDPDDLLTVRFAMDAVPSVKRQKWFFGDGEESGDASPTHTYARPGTYDVTVNVALANGKKYSRKRKVEIGRPLVD